MASGDGGAPADVEVVGLVRSPPEKVFEFLSDLRNHWRVADPFVHVLTLESSQGGAPDGATVAVRGPIGVRRTAQTRVVAARGPRLIIGTAEIGEQTRARVSWTLAPRFGDTRVRLAAEIDRAGPLDRLLLAAGGRRWLTRRFRAALERLDRELSAVVPVDGPGHDHVAAERPA
ncbi:MAG: SRPBCC family protein [Actinobacteria bacterium]|nr:SRPBCC family protein [Actinomycetota bacterium]